MADDIDTSSSNYYSIALTDDLIATSDTEQPSCLDKGPTSRQQRIAAAVERSKTEYQPEHAYSDRRAST